MNTSICPRCGTEVFDSRLCDECFADELDPTDAPEEVEVRVCGTCGSYVRDGDWWSHDEAVSDAELALDAVERSLGAHVEARDVDVDLRVEARDTDVYAVGVDFSATVRGFPVEESFEVPVEIKRETCPTCSKMSVGYYESIVQVRAENRGPGDDEVERAREIAYSVASKDYTDRHTFVSRVEEVDEGIDVYMSTTASGRHVARRMVEEFGGSYSDSPSLVGEDDGEEVHRVTYSVRLPEFVPGDLVTVDGTPVLVTSNRDVLKGIDLRTGESRGYGDAEVEKIGERSDAEATTVVNDSGDEIQVLSPETYDTVTLTKPGFVTQEQGDEVEAVETDEGVFVVPDG